MTPHLNDARAESMRHSQNVAEIQVVRKDYQPPLMSIRHDESIGGS
jgi:hypothetical protein